MAVIEYTGAGKIETPGVYDIYTFTATAGQVVYFDGQGSSNYHRTNWNVRDEEGTVVFKGGRVDDQDRQVKLDRGDTYTITVDGGGDATGTYQFQVLNVPPPE